MLDTVYCFLFDRVQSPHLPTRPDRLRGQCTLTEKHVDVLISKDEHVEHDLLIDCCLHDNLLLFEFLLITCSERVKHLMSKW